MSERVEMRDKLVLVTGASRGLGRQLAHAFAKRGCRLAMVARDSNALDELANLLRHQYSVNVSVFARDLSVTGVAARLIDEIRSAAGSVDMLINNAGTGWYKPFLDHTAAEHDRIIDLNFRSVVHLTRAVLPAMIGNGQGHIINIASDLSARPLANMAVYAASKYALRGFSLSLSQELRPQGIRVSLVNPGMIDTTFNHSQEGNMNPREALQPAELAELIAQIAAQPGYQLVDEVTVHPMMQDY
jgi:short-subunit dehydrogenase